MSHTDNALESASPVPAPWWHEGILYQIYVPSFQDGNGDGFGDLAGVLARLDYIAELGVSAIWLTPVQESPLLDFGYDVADYNSIGRVFGDLEVFDQVMTGAHARGLRVLMDFVPQHTSNEHPWFQDALGGRDSAHRDWYLWHDPAPQGGPPNNWASAFGGPAWTFHAPTGQYYYHAHLPEQPSLNWRNPQVRRAMFDVMRFWFDRGVDGFRVDAAWRLIKDEQLRDNPTGGEGESFEIGGALAHMAVRQVQRYTADQPELAGLLAQMRTVADEYDDRVLLGELHLTVERVAELGGLRGLDVPMNFALIDVLWRGRSIGDLIRRYEDALPPGAWPNWVLGNHDRSRVATRIGDDHVRGALTLLLTLRGTPTLYYGDELGLPDAPVAERSVRDCAALRTHNLALGRDPERMPMPWTSGRNAGFTGPDVEPWLPIPDWATRLSVAAQEVDPGSTLLMVRSLIRYRQASDALLHGNLAVLSDDDETLVLLRESSREVVLIAIGLTDRSRSLSLPEGRWATDWATSPGLVGHTLSGAAVVDGFGALILRRTDPAGPQSGTSTPSTARRPGPAGRIPAG